MRRFITAVTAAVTLAAAGAAWGHAAVRTESPKSKTTVSRSLSAVTVTFKAKVLAGEMTVGRGRTVVSRKASLRSGGKVLRAPIKGRLQAGRYTVRWKSVASDGHGQSGSWSFRVR